MFAQGCSVQMDEIVAQEQRRGTRCRIILELRLGFKMISRLWDKMHLQPSCDPNLFSIVDPGWQNALLWTVLGSLEETYMPGQCCKETGSGRLSVHKIFQWIGLETMDHLDFKFLLWLFLLKSSFETKMVTIVENFSWDFLVTDQERKMLLVNTAENTEDWKIHNGRNWRIDSWHCWAATVSSGLSALHCWAKLSNSAAQSVELDATQCRTSLVEWRALCRVHCAEQGREVQCNVEDGAEQCTVVAVTILMRIWGWIGCRWTAA